MHLRLPSGFVVRPTSRSVLAHRMYVDTPPLAGLLQGNFRLPYANLLKAEELEENPADPVAVQQPEVSVGELVDS